MAQLGFVRFKPVRFQVGPECGNITLYPYIKITHEGSFIRGAGMYILRVGPFSCDLSSFKGHLNHGAGTHGLVCLPVPLHINIFQIQVLYLF